MATSPQNAPAIQPSAMTTGTIVAIVVSCLVSVVGVLQGVDWVHIVGGQTAGWITAVLMAASALLHGFTGPSANDLTTPARRRMGFSDPQ